ncbi:trypsin-like serine protease, partial [Okeania sp. SIO2B9]|uniref:S1 family peptidase n=1 Tax=Okeania sp. SIO2B9 TaxID=2607782 RepID=UPI0014298CBF
MASQSIQTSVRSIVINDDAGEETAQALGAPLTSVTDILFFDEFENDFISACTGSLIASNYVLTAQHCVQDFWPEDLSVSFRSDDAENSVLADIAVTDIFQDDTFALLDGTDIAILELAEDAPDSIDPLRLFGYNPEDLIGKEATIVGFGDVGLGSDGGDTNKDGLRLAAENTIDLFDGGFNPAFNDIFGSNIFNLDFDDGTDNNNTLSSFGSSSSPLENEGTTAPGDSGAPLLVEVDGELLIAGVHSGGTSFAGEFGDVSWFTPVVEHRELIEDVGGEFVGGFVPSPTPTPTPSAEPVYGIQNGDFEDGFNGWSILGAATTQQNTIQQNTIQQRQSLESSTPASSGDSNGLIINDTLAVPTDEIEDFLGLDPYSLTDLSPDVEFVAQGSAIKQTFLAKAGDVITFDFNFLTEETLAPEFGFDSVNDFSFVSLSSDVLDDPILEILADVLSDTFTLVNSTTFFD